MFVEINSFTLDGGKAGWKVEFDDDTKNLAACLAGCRAERLLRARTPRKAKKGDFGAMRALLSRLPETERHAALAGGCLLADEKLRMSANLARRVADELMRRWSIRDRVARIEGDELAILLKSDTL